MGLLGHCSIYNGRNAFLDGIQSQGYDSCQGGSFDEEANQHTMVVEVDMIKEHRELAQLKMMAQKQRMS